jgi:hypothetical protein
MVSRLRYFEKKADKKVTKKPVSLKKIIKKKEKEEKLKQKKYFDIIKKRQRIVKKKEDDEKLSFAEQLAKVEVLKRKDEERKKEAERYFVKIQNPLLKLESQLRDLEFQKEKLIGLKKDRRSKEFKDISDKIKSKEKEIKDFKFTLTPEFKTKQEEEQKIELEQKSLSQLRRQAKQTLSSSSYFQSKSEGEKKALMSHYDKAKKEDLMLLIQTLPKANIVYDVDKSLDSSLRTEAGIEAISDAYDVIMESRERTKEAEAETKKKATKKQVEELAETRKEQDKFNKLYAEVVNSTIFNLGLYELRSQGKAGEEEADKIKRELPFATYKELSDFYDVIQDKYADKKKKEEDEKKADKKKKPEDKKKAKKAEKFSEKEEDIAEILKYKDMLGKDPKSKDVRLDKLKELAKKYGLATNKTSKIEMMDILNQLIPKKAEKPEEGMPKLEPVEAEEAEAETKKEEPKEPEEPEEPEEPKEPEPKKEGSGLNLKKMMNKHKKILSTISQDPKTHSIILGMASVHNKRHPKSMHMTIKYIIKQMKKGKVKGGKLHFKI